MRAVDLAIYADALEGEAARLAARAERAQARLREAAIEKRARRDLTPVAVERLEARGLFGGVDEAATQAELRALEATLDAVERVCIGSFSDARLVRLQELLGPGLCTSFGPKGIAQLRAASLSGPLDGVVDGVADKVLGGLRAACVQVPTAAKGVTLVDRRFVRAAHDRDLAVHVWTIDEPDEMHALLDLGVDGIMTDRPGVLKTVS